MTLFHNGLVDYIPSAEFGRGFQSYRTTIITNKYGWNTINKITGPNNPNQPKKKNPYQTKLVIRTE